MTSQEVGTGAPISLTYSPRGLPTSISSSANASTLGYDGAGQVSHAEIAGFGSATFSYNVTGQLADIVGSSGRSIRTTFDAASRPATLVDEQGRTSIFGYDAVDRLTRMQYPDGSVEEMNYDDANQLVSTMDRRGVVTTYEYDAAGQMTRSAGPNGELRLAYDAADQLTSWSDSLNRTWTNSYDALGRRTRLTHPDATFVQYAYDADGQLTQEIDEGGYARTFAHDAEGRLTRVVEPGNIVTSYEYDGRGFLTARVDALGRRTVMGYDDRGALTSVRAPSGRTRTMTYDSLGRLVSSTNARNQSESYLYDANVNMQRRNLPDGSAENYTYTADGFLETVQDARGTTTYGYDSVNHNLTRVTEPDGRYVRYAYDGSGRRVLMAHAMGALLPEAVTNYGYDSAGRLTALSDGAGASTNLGYDVLGRQTSVSRPNGTSTEVAYDLRDRVTQIVHRGPGGLVFFREEYQLDSRGNRTRVLRLDGTRTDHDYDALGRMTAERHYDSAAVLVTERSYVYDAVGNIVSRSGTEGVVNNTYDVDDQLTSSNDRSFAYDLSGNLTSIVDSSSDVVTFGWDHRDRLTQYQGGGSTVIYRYDHRGLRQESIAGNSVTKFLVDRTDGLGSVVRESDGTSASLATYMLGRGRQSKTTASGTTFYHGDALGSTRVLSNTAGSPVGTFSYFAYGELRGSTGGAEEHFLFSGEQRDAESSLDYLRARYYDPSAGRFLGRDPATGSTEDPRSFQPYAYAHGDPVRRRDPSGRNTIPELNVTQEIQMLLNKQQRIQQLQKQVEKAKDATFQTIRRLTAAMQIIALTKAQQVPFLGVEYFGAYPEVGEWVHGFVASAMFTGGVEHHSGVHGNAYAWVCLAPGGCIGDFKYSAPYGTYHMYFNGVLLAKIPAIPTSWATMANNTILGVYLHEYVHLVTRFDDFKNEAGKAAYGCQLARAKAFASSQLGQSPAAAPWSALNFLDVGMIVGAGVSAIAVASPENHRCFMQDGYWMAIGSPP